MRQDSTPFYCTFVNRWQRSSCTLVWKHQSSDNSNETRPEEPGQGERALFKASVLQNNSLWWIHSEERSGCFCIDSFNMRIESLGHCVMCIWAAAVSVINPVNGPELFISSMLSAASCPNYLAAHNTHSTTSMFWSSFPPSNRRCHAWNEG